ncbi:MAG: hypothetical protein ACRD2E_03165 [Terriglobales bacterium]
MGSDLQNLLRTLVATFGATGIPYMLTGSFAATLYGVPRTTYDVDFVVDPPSAGSLDAFLRQIGPLLYVDAEATREAWRRRSMFNVVDAAGWKADCIVRKDRAFSREEFGRRRSIPALGMELVAASAEDVILSKLEWSRQAGGSERQRRDVASILAVAGDQLDWNYLERWRGALGLAEEWARANEPER